MPTSPHQPYPTYTYAPLAHPSTPAVAAVPYCGPQGTGLPCTYYLPVAPPAPAWPLPALWPAPTLHPALPFGGLEHPALLSQHLLDWQQPQPLLYYPGY